MRFTQFRRISVRQKRPAIAMFFSMSARSGLLLWLGICAVLGMLFGWPVLGCSMAMALGPAYHSIRSRIYLIAVPFAVAGALIGALAFTPHGIIWSVFISLLIGIVVGQGLALAAMWLRHWREVGGRSA